MLITERWKFLALTLLVCASMTGCTTVFGSHEKEGPIAAISGNAPRQDALSGFEALKKGDYKDASLHINRAIKLDPTNSRLQFLNGLTYHLQAVEGDQSRYTLAEQGYRLARKFDPSNWMASYYCGLLNLDQRRYKEAQEQLAEVLLFVKDRPEVYYAMLIASYYAHDLTTAVAMLNKLEELEGRTLRVQRAGTMISAATGNFDGADSYLAALADDEGTEALTLYLRQRLQDWREIHGNISVGGSGAVSHPEPVTLQKSSTIYTDRVRKNERVDDGLRELRQKLRTKGGNDSRETEKTREKMIIVDVVIIRTEENISSRKGVNLLNGLTLQFGDKADHAYEYRYENKSTSPAAKTISKLLTIPQIEYSLNIANAHNERNEILARPTLVALDGKTSEFFSGTNIQAAVVGDSNSGSSGTVKIKDDVGVSLKVKPKLLDNGRVSLEVTAERTFLKTPSNQIEFSYKIEKSKTRVSAFIEMDLDETLILSGLSEKETERTRDSVPLLQSIPGLQYFFSQKDQRDFQRSVLILLTPRAPEYVYSKRHNGSLNDAKSSRLNELKARYSDWFQPYPNWASVFHHLQSNSLYREFRTGDVTMERWESQPTFFENLKKGLGFLYY